jgi:hypothetical protein
MATFSSKPLSNSEDERAAGSRRRGDAYECARREGRGAARRRAAQAPVLLAAWETAGEHDRRLASRTDKPGRPVGWAQSWPGVDVRHDDPGPVDDRSRQRRPIWSVSPIVRLSIPIGPSAQCASAGSIPDPSGSEHDVAGPGGGAALCSRFGT